MVTSLASYSMPIAGTRMPSSVTAGSEGTAVSQFDSSFTSRIKKKLNPSLDVWQTFKRVTKMEVGVQNVSNGCLQCHTKYMKMTSTSIVSRHIDTHTRGLHKNPVQAALAHSTEDDTGIDVVHPARKDIQYRFGESCTEWVLNTLSPFTAIAHPPFCHMVITIS